MFPKTAFFYYMILGGMGITGSCIAESLDTISRQYRILTEPDRVVSPKDAQKFFNNVAQIPKIPAKEQPVIREMLYDVVQRAGGSEEVAGRGFMSIITSKAFRDRLSEIQFTVLMGALSAAAIGVFTGDPLLALEIGATSTLIGQTTGLIGGAAVKRLPIAPAYQDFATRRITTLATTAATGGAAAALGSGRDLVTDVAMTLYNQSPQLQKLEKKIESSAWNWARATANWCGKQVANLTSWIADVEGGMGLALDASDSSR